MNREQTLQLSAGPMPVLKVQGVSLPN